MKTDHERWMSRCLDLAQIARSTGNTPVGSLVVSRGEVIGEGIASVPMSKTVRGHAEILACQDAIERVPGCDFENSTLYTTTEPCLMCSYVIRELKIALVVDGKPTPIIGGISGFHPILVSPSLDNWRPSPKVLVMKPRIERTSEPDRSST